MPVQAADPRSVRAADRSPRCQLQIIQLDLSVLRRPHLPLRGRESRGFGRELQSVRGAESKCYSHEKDAKIIRFGRVDRGRYGKLTQLKAQPFHPQ